MKYTCLNSWDNSVQSPRNNQTFGIQPLETHSSNVCSAYLASYKNKLNYLLCLRENKCQTSLMALVLDDHDSLF